MTRDNTRYRETDMQKECSDFETALGLPLPLAENTTIPHVLPRNIIKWDLFQAERGTADQCNNVSTRMSRRRKPNI